ncbi:MAG: HEPN domain-containing protein [Bacteroidota bacterium]
MKKDEPDISVWLKYAEGDLHLAQCGMQDKNPVYHSICFLCQSSAEKYLKALLLKNNWKLRKTHDLIFLLNETQRIINLDIQELIDEASLLNSFVEETRYPGDIDLEYFNRNLAEETINAAERIKQFVINHI